MITQCPILGTTQRLLHLAHGVLIQLTTTWAALENIQPRCSDSAKTIRAYISNNIYSLVRVEIDTWAN